MGLEALAGPKEGQPHRGLSKGLSKRGISFGGKRVSSVEWTQKTITETICTVRTAICEATLWTHWMHMGDLTASHHCQLLELSTLAFVDLVQSYLQMNRIMRQHAILFV